MINPLKFLLPNEQKFFSMLNKQSSILLEGANLFFDSVNKYNELNSKQRVEQQKKMKDIEEKGDKIANYIIDQINMNFITPFDREDIHQLTTLIDDVLDLIDATYRRMIFYNLKENDETIIELNRLIFDSIKEVNLAINDLKKLKDVKIHCVRINILEHETDSVLGNGLKRLFKNVKDPIILFKTKEIYEFIEKISDRCKDVSTLLQSIVVKHG